MTIQHTKDNLEYLGSLRGVHSKEVCENEICVIHNPSGHHMHNWPLTWRGDRGIMERICEHGVGHPDFDCANVRAGDGVHGCDGCCNPNK